MSESSTATVVAQMQFIPAALAGGPVVASDLRQPSDISISGPVAVDIQDAAGVEGLGLHSSGFERVHAPTQVQDFYDCDEVMGTYYAECKALAQHLTGARHTFTFDHIIREPERQFNGGGIDGQMRESGPTAGGGYVNTVHMDYTDRSGWEDYLGVHGATVPEHAEHVYVLNFWRPLSESVDDNPLAICDARTVRSEDLMPVDIFGYGANNYSWHNIGIETFSVCAADRHRWYYHAGLTPEDVLVIKSYDSDGVIGRCSPHASFVHPQPVGIPRRSIELRVLCFA